MSRGLVRGWAYLQWRSRQHQPSPMVLVVKPCYVYFVDAVMACRDCWKGVATCRVTSAEESAITSRRWIQLAVTMCDALGESRGRNGGDYSVGEEEEKGRSDGKMKVDGDGISRMDGVENHESGGLK